MDLDNQAYLDLTVLFDIRFEPIHVFVPVEKNAIYFKTVETNTSFGHVVRC